MEKDDDDYSTETESNSSIASLDFNTIDTGGGVHEFVQCKMRRKKERLETKPRAVLPCNLRAIVLMDKHISHCLHGHDYDKNLSLRVVGDAVQMQKGYLQKVGKLSKDKGRLVPTPCICDTICHLFQIGHESYSQIVGGYLSKRQVYVSGKNKAGRAGNSNAKETCILQMIALQILVRDFVCTCQMNRQRVTGRQVLDFFVEQKHLFIPVDRTGHYQQLPFKSAYRGVQRWLKEFGGYERGKRKGNLVPSEANVAKKHLLCQQSQASRGAVEGGVHG
jgi:very-short-patch-repair endonuclease